MVVRKGTRPKLSIQDDFLKKTGQITNNIDKNHLLYF